MSYFELILESIWAAAEKFPEILLVVGYRRNIC